MSANSIQNMPLKQSLDQPLTLAPVAIAIARFTDLSPDAIEQLQRQQHN
ncbi:hypothetical protein [Microcystis sp. M112S1]|nr:hypothetical protein [Microcystis sp. M112S1]